VSVVLQGGGKQFGRFGDLDDRRSLRGLLERLGDGVAPEVGCARRRAVLEWCAGQVSAGKMPVLVDPKTVGLTGEVFADLVVLSAQYALDLDRVTARLERLVAGLR
jgi:predicted Zn-dependent protease